MHQWLISFWHWMKISKATHELVTETEILEEGKNTLSGGNYRHVHWALTSGNVQVVWRFQFKSKENPKLFLTSESPDYAPSSHTWSESLALKEKAGLLGLTHEVVAPQGGLWVMHHLGGDGWVVGRHSVHVALWILLQHRVKEKNSYLTPQATKVINANSSYHIIWESSYPSSQHILCKTLI